MIVNLREGKARLSELVERACRGEEVLITVRGKVRVRLSRAEPAEAADMAAWVQELKELHLGQRPAGLTSEQLLEVDREEREF